MHLVELQRLLVKLRLLADAFDLPRRDVHIALVVAQRFALRRLALLAEVAAARLAALQGVEREQLRELQVVGDAASVFETLIRLSGVPGTDTFCQKSSRSLGIDSSARRRPSS